jgi:phenylpropionate dioxygenase-like ring-hydroxylating dioxygenase large terminal subunit
MNVDLDALRRNWFVACRSALLRDRPLARTVLGLPLVLFRSDGVAVALVDRCPHRNARLSAGRVDRGLIECAYHGWSFDATGACRRIPGLGTDCARPSRRAQAVPSAERDGLVWVSVAGNSSAPALPEPRYPTEAGGFDGFIWATWAQCSLIDGLENLLDATHPHFVHAGLVRTATRRRVVQVSVKRNAEMAEAVYTETAPPAGWIPRLLEGERTASIGRFFPPATAQLEYRSRRGTTFVLTAMYTPCDERRVMIHAMLSTPKSRVPQALKELALRAIFGRVLEQDRAILRAQQANIERFSGARFTSTPLDVMRPHILHFLTREPGTAVSPYEGSLKMEI